MAISGVSGVSAVSASPYSISPTYTITDTVIRETVFPDGSVSSTTEKTVTTSSQNTGSSTETVVTYATSGSARGAGPYTTPTTPASNAVGPYGAQINFNTSPSEQLDGTLSTFSVFA